MLGCHRPTLMTAYYPATLGPPNSMGGAPPPPDLRGFTPQVTAGKHVICTGSRSPSVGIRQRRDLNASRKAGFSATVSAFALIIVAPIFTSLAQYGTKPHRSVSSVRSF